MTQCESADHDSIGSPDPDMDIRIRKRKTIKENFLKKISIFKSEPVKRIKIGTVCC